MPLARIDALVSGVNTAVGGSPRNQTVELVDASMLGKATFAQSRPDNRFGPCVDVKFRR